MARHVLNAEQQAAVDAIVQPRGARLIVVEGGPGQGKTTVIEESIRMLRIPVAVLASCACAAVRVNVIDPNARGMTISMFTKIWNGFQRGDYAHSLRKRVAKAAKYDGLQELAKLAMTGENRAVHGRLFIDEFSMMSSDEMTQLCHIFRDMPNVVFVLTGDPEQLRSVDSSPFHHSAEIQALAAAGRMVTHTLIENFRFKADPELGDLVEGFRTKTNRCGQFAMVTPFMHRKKPSFDAAFKKQHTYPFIVAADNETVNRTNKEIVSMYVKSFGGDPLPIYVYSYKENEDTLVDQTWAAGVRGVVTNNVYTDKKELLMYNGQPFTVRSIRAPEDLCTKNKMAMVVALDTGGDIQVEATKEKGKWVIPARVAYAQTVYRVQGAQIPPDTPYVVKVTWGMTRQSWLVAVSRAMTLDRFYIDVQNMNESEAFERMFAEDEHDDGMLEFIHQEALKPKKITRNEKRKASTRAASIFTKSRRTENAGTPLLDSVS